MVHLYSNNKISFDFTNILNKINDSPFNTFKYKINSFDDPYFVGNSDNNKQKLIKLVNLFVDNSLQIFNNLNTINPKCSQYIDIIHDQRLNIYNIINSYIITMPNYEKYDLYKQTVGNIIKITDDIFNIVSNKCSQQYINNNLPYDYNKYNLKIPSGPRKDFQVIDDLKNQYSNSNSFEYFP